MPNIIKMMDIKKAFGSTLVLKNVALTVQAGSIHALLGENGTGKSTLMNILTGLISCDEGTIQINNQEIKPFRNKQIKSEITFVHQELSLVNDLTIYENLFLGHELTKHGHLDRSVMVQQTKAILERMGLSIDPKMKVRYLNPSLKQMIEVGRGLVNQAKIIIMDEPTSSLDDVEIDALFQVMRTLKQNGITIIFISHKLSEVLKICDHYTVMRDGYVVQNGAVTEQLTERELSALMVGKKLVSMTKTKRKNHGQSILVLKQLSKQNQFSNVNLHVDAGEVVGVTGLLGDGRSELFQTVAGANNPYQGQIVLNSELIHMRSTQSALVHHIAYIPKNRKENGIIADLNITDNTLLPVLKRLTKYGVVRPKIRAEKFKALATQVNLKYGAATDLIGTLSGGNQQKVLIARALGSTPKLVIFDNPTQGVDIGAKAEIYELIQDLADQGVGFVILTSEFAELKRLCDRIYVMYAGQIVNELKHDELNENELMFYATGGRTDHFELKKGG